MAELRIGPDDDTGAPIFVGSELQRARHMIRASAVCLLLAMAGCGGFDTGLNPRPDVRKELGPLVVPPAGVVRGDPDLSETQASPSPSAYTPSRVGGRGTSRR